MMRRLTAAAAAAALAALAALFLAGPPAGAQSPSTVALEAPGVTAVSPNAINSSGQVSGSATFNGTEAAFLWTPTAANALAGAFNDPCSRC